VEHCASLIAKSGLTIDEFLAVLKS